MRSTSVTVIIYVAPVVVGCCVVPDVPKGMCNPMYFGMCFFLVMNHVFLTFAMRSSESKVDAILFIFLGDNASTSDECYRVLCLLLGNIL